MYLLSCTSEWNSWLLCHVLTVVLISPPTACWEHQGGSSVDGRGPGARHGRQVHQLQVCQVHAKGRHGQGGRGDVLQVHKGENAVWVYAYTLKIL